MGLFGNAAAFLDVELNVVLALIAENLFKLQLIRLLPLKLGVGAGGKPFGINYTVLKKSGYLGRSLSSLLLRFVHD